MKFLSRLLAVLLSGPLLAPIATAQDDGARAYLPAPAGVNAVIVLGVTIEGNRAGDPATVIQGAELDIDTVALMGTRTFALGDKPVSAFVVLPYGRVSGRVSTTLGDFEKSSQGGGDLTFGTAITLLGAPPVTVPEFVAFKPEASLGVLLKASAPTGQYDRNSAVNLGGNRWMFQVGAPFTYYVGNSMVDPELLTFELMPTASFFTDNTDLANAGRSSQEVLYRVEGHITRSFAGSHFLSLDGLFTQGGAVDTDGVRSAGPQRSLAIGATYSYSPNAANVVRFTYGSNVARNDDGMRGSMFRVFWIRSF